FPCLAAHLGGLLLALAPELGDALELGKALLGGFEGSDAATGPGEVYDLATLGGLDSFSRGNSVRRHLVLVGAGDDRHVPQTRRTCRWCRPRPAVPTSPSSPSRRHR